jgi:hypothetical protein
MSMRYRKEVKKVIIKMLSVKLDARMARHGFRRNPKSLEYRRMVPGAKQVIFMYFESHPSSDPSADAYIYPWTFIGLPAVYDLAVQIVNDPNLLGDDREKTLSQPIDWAAPKGQRPSWYLTGEDEIMDAGDSLGDYIERWVLSLLDDFSSLRGFVRAYEEKDQRALFHHSKTICVAAANLLLGNPEAAMQALERELGRPDLRAKYAKAFEFVQNKLALDKYTPEQ